MSFTVYPALDIRNGQVVRLLQGDYAQQTTYGDDPLPRRLQLPPSAPSAKRRE